MNVTKPQIRMAADPATSLIPVSDDEASRYLRQRGVPPEGNYICFALRPWGDFHDFESFAKAAEYAYHRYGLTALFLPIEVPRDLSACRQTVSKMQTPHYVLADAPEDVCLTMALLRKMKLVCGMRLHSIVFSAVACAPFFAVSYDIKVSGFMNYIGLSDHCCTLNQVTMPWLCEQIDQLMNHPTPQHSLEIKDHLSRLEAENRRAAAELLGVPLPE